MAKDRYKAWEVIEEEIHTNKHWPGLSQLFVNDVTKTSILFGYWPVKSYTMEDCHGDWHSIDKGLEPNWHCICWIGWVDVAKETRRDQWWVRVEFLFPVY